jgi:uncharacterized protein (TIGR02118 family)
LTDVPDGAIVYRDTVGAFTRGGDAMVKLTVLYSQPDDPAAFEKYYLETHVPVHGLKIPNVIRFEVNKAIATPGEQPLYYRSADLYFDDVAALQGSMESPITQGAIADLENFASGKYSTLITEVQTIPAQVPARA